MLGAITTYPDLLGHLLERWRRCVLFRRGKKREESDPLPSELRHLCHKFPGFSWLAARALVAHLMPLCQPRFLEARGVSTCRSAFTGRAMGHAGLSAAGHLRGQGRHGAGRAGGRGPGCAWRCLGARADTLGLPLPCELPGTGLGPRAPAHLLSSRLTHR